MDQACTSPRLGSQFKYDMLASQMEEQSKKVKLSLSFWIAILLLVLYLQVAASLIGIIFKLKFDNGLGMMVLPIIFYLTLVLELKAYLIYTLPLAVFICFRLWINRNYWMFLLLSISVIGIAVENQFPLFNAPNSELRGTQSKMLKQNNKRKTYFNEPKKVTKIQGYNVLDLEDNVSVYIPKSSNMNQNSLNLELSIEEKDLIKDFLNKNLLGQYIQMDPEPANTKNWDTLLNDDGNSMRKIREPARIQFNNSDLTVEILRDQIAKD